MNNGKSILKQVDPPSPSADFKQHQEVAINDLSSNNKITLLDSIVKQDKGSINDKKPCQNHEKTAANVWDAEQGLERTSIQNNNDDDTSQYETNGESNQSPSTPIVSPPVSNHTSTLTLEILPPSQKKHIKCSIGSF
eukprot:1642197-Ditylum_brightwellii.AAC.1